MKASTPRSRLVSGCEADLPPLSFFESLIAMRSFESRLPRTTALSRRFHKHGKSSRPSSGTSNTDTPAHSGPNIGPYPASSMPPYNMAAMVAGGGRLTSPQLGHLGGHRWPSTSAHSARCPARRSHRVGAVAALPHRRCDGAWRAGAGGLVDEGARACLQRMREVARVRAGDSIVFVTFAHRGAAKRAKRFFDGGSTLASTRPGDSTLSSAKATMSFGFFFGGSEGADIATRGILPRDRSSGTRPRFDMLADPTVTRTSELKMHSLTLKATCGKTRCIYIGRRTTR